jgi:hypothetical protein
MFVAHSALAGKRDLRIDSLRGLLLVFMAVDHIASDLRQFTDHAFGFVSAAEGFVFLSGLVAGLVYTRRWRQAGATTVRQGCMRRSAVLYTHHALLFLFVWAWTLGGRLLDGVPPPGTPAIDAAAPWSALAAGLSLLQQPPLLDILPMYCGFMLVLPGLLAAFDRGQQVPVLVLSGSVWLFTNAFLPQAPWTAGVVQTSALSVAAWQLLFVAGAACGHAWATGQRLVPRPRGALVICALVSCSVCFLVRHAFVASPLPLATLGWLTNKNNLAPLRLGNTAALFYLVYVTATRRPRLYQWRPLAFLGRNSLPVFSTHVATAYVLAAFPHAFADSSAGRWLGTLLIFGAMTSAAAIAEHGPVRRPAPVTSPPLRARLWWKRPSILRHAHIPVGAANRVHRRGR